LMFPLMNLINALGGFENFGTRHLTTNVVFLL
jgi:hypothetical protein